MHYNYIEFVYNAYSCYKQTDYQLIKQLSSNLSYLFYNRGKPPKCEAAFITSSYYSTAQLHNNPFGLTQFTSVCEWLTMGTRQRHCKKRHITPVTHSMVSERWRGRGIWWERDPGKKPVRRNGMQGISADKVREKSREMLVNRCAGL